MTDERLPKPVRLKEGQRWTVGQSNDPNMPSGTEVQVESVETLIPGRMQKSKLKPVKKPEAQE